MQQLYAAGKLGFYGQLAPLAATPQFQRLMSQATRRAWVVYAKRPFAGPRQVLAYLSRYTHRVAISPARLLSLDQLRKMVTFAWKGYADGARHKTMTLAVGEFVRRFCLHLLPARFVKIRHYGLLGNRRRHDCVARARALLDPPLAGAEPADTPSKPAPLRVCPFCGSERLCLIEIVPPRSAFGPLRLDSS